MERHYNFPRRTDRYLLEERRTSREIARDACAHSEWEKIRTDPVHWVKRCLSCTKLFESESAHSDIHGDEILL